MRVVVDTSVFISAALKENSRSAMAAHLASARHVLVKSFVTLAQPHLAPLIPTPFRNWLSEVLARAGLVPSSNGSPLAAIDDKFLELAINGNSDPSVTGANDLRALNPFRQIGIVHPAAFVRGVGR
jgi:predicted nucleic acid-binding protein